jgi:hypothetical protein
VRKIERRDRRLADVRVGLAGDGAEPGFDGVDAFDDAGEVARLDDFLDQSQPSSAMARSAPHTVTVAVT